MTARADHDPRVSGTDVCDAGHGERPAGAPCVGCAVAMQLARWAAEPPVFWAVFERPLDYPHGYVVRRFRGVFATGDASYHATLAAARAAVPRGLCRVPRHPADKRSLVETWL